MGEGRRLSPTPPFSIICVQKSFLGDLEQIWIGLFGQIDIEERDQRLIALRIDDLPLFEGKFRRIENQLDLRGSTECRFIFNENGDRFGLALHVNNLYVAAEVDLVLEQKFKRRLTDEVNILRGRLAVMHRHREAVGNDLERRGRRIFKA